MANPLSWLWRRKKEEPIQAPKAEADINTIYPQGFFHVLNLSGKPAGVGFYCRRCHLHVPHSAPTTIFHCGAPDTLDPKANLQTVQLTNPAQPPTVNGRTMLDASADDWDGEVKYDGNGIHTENMDTWGSAFRDPHSASFRPGGK